MYIEAIDSYSGIQPIGGSAQAKATDDPIMAAAATVAVLHQMKEVALACAECDELSEILAKHGNNPDGIPALLYAIKVNDERAVDILLRHGASAFTRDHLNRNALYFAVESGSINLVRKFIALGVSPNEVASLWENTPFTLAIEQGKNELAKYLYEHGGQVYTRDDNYGRAWCACFKVGNLDMVKFLVERGAERRYEDGNGVYGSDRIALFLLYGSEDDAQNMRSERIKCLKYLIDKKLVTLPHNTEEYIQIIANTYPEALECLLDNNYLSPNQYFGNEANPHHHILLLATINLNFKVELVEILIKKGSDVKATVSGRTVLHYAACSCNRTLNETELKNMKSLFSMLIRKGAELNAKDHNGKTVLAQIKDANLRQWLIAQGAKE